MDRFYYMNKDNIERIVVYKGSVSTYGITLYSNQEWDQKSIVNSLCDFAEDNWNIRYLGKNRKMIELLYG